ncbi:AAA family ATPase [Kribbella sp. NPDC049227]|uniref:helix-turn-helix transcriptional regulator n=1 Tax=Kribbella sp. NPDC049227 TaxID=3364113 RepID=UPI0037216BA7
MGGDLRFAGRDAERQLLGDAVRAAVGGVPRAVVIHGEAGIGKTRLAREVCRDPELKVLWGSCVHFGAASVPFAPIGGVLQNWFAGASAEESAEVLDGVDALAALLPALGGGGSVDTTRLPVLVDLVLNRIATHRPTVVVVDDLQWADVASLDVLSYLIAGFRDQRLLLLATCRTEERPEGHPLHGWLADMRRMPLFSEITLDSLDLDAAAGQIEGLLGRAPDIELVSEALTRSDGNPYLIELMVRGLSGLEHALPTTVPTALREALLAAWHSLSDQARLVTRILAVGGRPTSSAVLTDVASMIGLEASLISPCLLEAQDRGVVHTAGGGIWWFRHPLLAEVLYDCLSPDQAAELHADYIRVLEPEAAEVTAADLAVHHERAGHVDETFRWSLVAADQAARLQAPAEEAIQLRRACALWETVSPSIRGGRDDRISLLRRTSTTCLRAALPDMAVALLTEALSLVDKQQDPLLACDLLVSRADARWQSTSPGQADLEGLGEAIALTTGSPESAERAIAFAHLAELEAMYGMPDGAVHATEAVRIGHRSGSTQTYARALSARAAVSGYRAPLASLADAELSVKLARSCGDTDTAIDAALWRERALHALGRRADLAEVTRVDYYDAVAAGVGSWAYFFAYQAANALIDLGRWQECRTLLRSALGARCTGIPGAGLRLAASLLAVRSGRTEEARQHFDRALELVSEDFRRLRPSVTVTGIELMIAEGRAADAVTWARPRLSVPDYPGPDDDDALPAFARAVAEATLDGGGHGFAASEPIDSILRDWPREPFAEALNGVDVQAMQRALLAAELARCRNASDQPERWREGVETSGAAGSRWHHAMAQWRCAEAGLSSGWTRPKASDLVRQAHRCAVELGARPLQTEVESLARRSKIDLTAPIPVVPTVKDPRLAALTDREREVLAFLVVGRSNGEIAKELFISDKTVSVHVSNILRKTGTASRVAAAALVERRLPDQ